MADWLVYLRGGPLDGQVYPSSALLGRAKPRPGVDEYNWTKERITNPITGDSAQVWVHKDEVS